MSEEFETCHIISRKGAIEMIMKIFTVLFKYMVNEPLQSVNFILSTKSLPALSCQKRLDIVMITACFACSDQMLFKIIDPKIEPKL